MLDWSLCKNQPLGGWRQNIAKVRKCPNITIVNSLSGCLSFFFFFFCNSFVISYYEFCSFVFLFFCIFLCAFLSGHQSDQMSEGSQVWKVTLCVKILKWRSVSQSVTHWPRSGIELPGQLKMLTMIWLVQCCRSTPTAAVNSTDMPPRWLKITTMTKYGHIWPHGGHIWPYDHMMVIYDHMTIQRLDHHLILSLSFPPWPGCRLVRPPEFSSRYQMMYHMVPKGLSTKYLVVPMK